MIFETRKISSFTTVSGNEDHIKRAIQNVGLARSSLL